MKSHNPYIKPEMGTWGKAGIIAAWAIVLPIISAIVIFLVHANDTIDDVKTIKQDVQELKAENRIIASKLDIDINKKPDPNGAVGFRALHFANKTP